MKEFVVFVGNEQGLKKKVELQMKAS